jgi:hypothetical protein
MSVFLPFLSRRFLCVSSHGKKMTLAKMKTIPLSVCASVRPNMSHQTHSNRAKEVAFHVFRYNFACGPSILILKRLAESSEHADSKSILFFFKFSLLKDSKAVKTTLGPVCVCERQPFLTVRQSPEKNSAF